MQNVAYSLHCRRAPCGLSCYLCAVFKSVVRKAVNMHRRRCSSQLFRSVYGSSLSSRAFAAVQANRDNQRIYCRPAAEPVISGPITLDHRLPINASTQLIHRFDRRSSAIGRYPILVVSQCTSAALHCAQRRHSALSGVA